jgi:hypothetical protein
MDCGLPRQSRADSARSRLLSRTPASLLWAHWQVTVEGWGLPPRAVVARAGAPSVFLRDPDGNLLRLVEEP